MNTKLIGIFFILFSVCQIGFGLKCYYLTDKIESYECNKTLADITYSGLENLFKVPDLTTPADTYNCVNLEIHTLAADLRFKGCIFSDIKVCELEHRPERKFTKTCSQCNGDNCNPAGRAISQFGIIGVSAIIAVISKIIL